ncbi:MAG: MFS transporter [Alphaproteobacteria bacterium]
MIDAIRHPEYRKLFSAQISSLLGTGLMTVALALLAFEIGGKNAGFILGTIFTLKMVAYVAFAPIANALVERISVKWLLVGLDIARLGLTAFIPFVETRLEIFVLVFLFQLFSAAFTPAFQSLIPEILKDEKRYTSALSLSRLAYDLETMLSPFLAGLLLFALLPSQLFWGASVCFGISVIFVLSARLPTRSINVVKEKFFQKLSKGFNIYIRTPRLRGLLAVNFALALSISWILVNSIVFAGISLKTDALAYTYMMTAYGVGSIAAALAAPRLIMLYTDRTIMLGGAFALGILPLAILLPLNYPAVLFLWMTLGAAASLVMTPGGRVLVRSTESANRPALFAAQFSLSHLGWLLAYPLAGWLGTVVRLESAFVILGLTALITSLIAWRLWPKHDPVEREHTHLPTEHTHENIDAAHHQEEHAVYDGPNKHRHVKYTHSHAFFIDGHHPVWKM